MQTNEEFQERRHAFDRLCSQLWNPSGEPYEVFNRYTCPACGYPTLEGPAMYEMCVLCEWEDDGQDDESAEEVWGGPNGYYSLAEARLNFSRFGCMYSPDDIEDFKRANKNAEERTTLRKGYDSLLSVSDSNKLADQVLAVKKLEGTPTTREEYWSRQPLSYDLRKGLFHDDRWLSHPVWEGTIYDSGWTTDESAVESSLRRWNRMTVLCRSLRGKSLGFDRHSCEACGLPTLQTDEKQCLLCGWPEKPTDSDVSCNEEKPLCQRYSLSEAQIHFEKNLTMYAPEDEPDFGQSQTNILKKCLLIRAYLALSADSPRIENEIRHILELEEEIRKELEEYKQDMETRKANTHGGLEEEIARGTFKNVKALLFNIEYGVEDIDVYLGLHILDRLHNEGTLTDDQRAWLLAKLREDNLIFHIPTRRALPEPPTPDRFWWFTQDGKKTPEEQIAYDMRFEDSYPGYKRP